MDVFSHGLWGGVALGRKERSYFWWAFFISIFPDAASFGVLMVARIFGLSKNSGMAENHMDISQIPNFVNWLYNITHSLIIFALVFFIIWILFKKTFWPLLAWGIHILIDIPSHSLAFFPTPFLWPVSDFKINGISWGEPIIFIPNLFLLFMAYSIWGFVYWQNKKKKDK